MLLGITKLAVGVVTELGVGYITGEAIKKVVNPENLTKLGKVCVGAASFGIGALAGAKVGDHVQGMIDEAVVLSNKVVASVKEKIESKKEAKAKQA